MMLTMEIILFIYDVNICLVDVVVGFVLSILLVSEIRDVSLFFSEM